ncbi:Na+/H+ antiporter subunit E [candidate division CSSED10-310 bacterium]|uniref:Na+/H+ antiporter subunit E n=1 Tax=candidate division CSSED10-310 bacterium TaxID=2855610 RepID=A0ABV6YT44_UNCC1
MMNEYSKNHEEPAPVVTPNSTYPPRKHSISTFIFTFMILFVIWIIFSGRFDSFHLTLGIISCALVAYYSADLLFINPISANLARIWFRFIMYFPWLLYQIFMSNLHVLYLVFHPRMMELIDPRIFKFKSKIKNQYGLLTFANSITLTPGTITVSVSLYGDFTVHAIDEYCRDPLPGEMEARIAKIFGE